MLRKTISTTMMASALLLGSYAVPQRANAGVSVSINLGDDRYRPYRTGMERYFQVQDQDVLMLSNRGLSAHEVPLALFIANRARVSPEMVMQMRLSGMRWDSIVRRYGLSPATFYVPVNDYSGPYARLYGHPRSAWDSMYLSDEDYMDLANLKFLTDYYGYDSSRVIQLRSEGRDFVTIADLIGNVLDLSSNHRYNDRYNDNYYNDGYGYGDQYGSTGVDDMLAPFLYTLVNYFGRPQQDIYYLQQRGISDYDLPVVLYLSRNARVTPMTIADMRLRGMNWMDIAYRYNLSPEIFYVPMDYSYVQGTVYAPVYNMYRGPRSGWANLRLSDNDIVNMVNLKVQAEGNKTSPREIIQRRAKGEDFKAIAREFHPRTMTQTERQQYNSEAAARREARNREQTMDQTDRQQRNSEAAARREARNREQATNERTNEPTNEQTMTEQEMRQQRNSEAAARRDARIREQEMNQQPDRSVAPETQPRQSEMTQEERQQRNSEAAARRDARMRQQQANQQAREQRKAEAAAQRNAKQKAADDQAANEKQKAADDQAANEKNKKPKKKDN